MAQCSANRYSYLICGGYYLHFTFLNQQIFVNNFAKISKVSFAYLKYCSTFAKIKSISNMKKALLFIAMLIAGLLIGGSFDADTQKLESQPNHYSK